MTVRAFWFSHTLFSPAWPNDLTARYRDLGPDWHTKNLDPARKPRDLVRQLTALGHDVTLTPAGA